jgi:CDP-diacylglycerol--glycerol-3-phosphate 3-phosphatidyltransferase
LQWLLTATAVNAYVLWLLWTGLGKKHSLHQEVLQPHLGVANWLTIARAFLIGALGGFLFQGPPGSAAGAQWLIWLPGTLYIVAVLIDYLDGYVARIMRSETRLGEWLDTQIDALGLLVAPVLAIGYNRLPIYYISVSLAYYLFQFGIWRRRQKDRPVIDIKPHPAKRMLAGFQMGLVSMALLPAFSRPTMTIAATIFMLPLLAGFFRDALVAGGYARVNDLQQTRWDRHLDFLSTKLVPIFLRLIITLTVMYVLFEAIVAAATGDQSAALTVLNAAMPFNLSAMPVFAAAGFMIAVGFMARSGALLICVMVAEGLTTWHSPFSLFVLLLCSLTLILTGSGVGSMWRPEDKLLLERQGQRQRSVSRKGCQHPLKSNQRFGGRWCHQTKH